MYSGKNNVHHPQYHSNLCPQIPQTHLYLAHIHAKPGTSNQYAYVQGVRPQYPPQATVQYQRRLNVSETAPQHRLVPQMSNDLEDISRRLYSTTFALRSEEITVKKQAKEIEMLRRSNEQLIKQNIDLTVRAENASKALVEKTKVVDEQNLEIVDLKGKHESLEKKNGELNDQIIDLTFKLEESQSKERTLKKQEEEMGRQMQEISKRLDTTTIALKTEEHITRLQAKEIETLKKTIDQLNKRYLVLNADAQNALRASNDNSRLVQEQVLEQFENALKNVLISNDMIIESLKRVQTAPEEKKQLMVSHNETLQHLNEQEMMQLRELEEQVKLDENLELFEFDFCDDSL